MVVTTKTYATTAVGARRSVTKVLRELGVEAVDIFLLHAVDSADELVRAVGVSSHSCEVLARLLRLPEVDIALAVVNETVAWMKDASPAKLTLAVASALRYVFGYQYAHAICVGITSETELEADVAIWRSARRVATR